MAEHQAGRTGNTFETADPELAVHLLRGSYGDRLRIVSRGRPGEIRADQSPLSPAVRLDQLSCACTLDVEADLSGILVVVHVRAGRVSYRSVDGERRYRQGDVCLAALPEAGNTAWCDDVHLATVVLYPALLARVDGIPSGRSPGPVRLTGYEPVSAAAARHWKATYAYVLNEILGVPEAAAQPLLVAAAERLLVTSILGSFPNDARTDPTIEDRHDAHPATLRRAMAFIEENAHRAITVADIASAANVTVRAVQLAFRRHRDTTPLAYLRQVRLEHAHRELIGADPARETVTAVAYRWGFPSTSKFAADYRAAYGVTPSRSLRG